MDGKRVPSVTTILSRFKESGGLVYWAWDLGIQRIDYRQVKDDAATAGTIAHKMVESDIRGVEGPKKDNCAQEIWDKALIGFSGYLEWKDQTQMKPLKTEVGLVCACHRYGGCLDSIGINKKRALLDWKFANGVYGEYLCQLAGYGHLHEVNFPEETLDGGYHLVRFGKEDGSFHHHWWPDLSVAWKAFELMRQLYDLDKTIKGML